MLNTLSVQFRLATRTDLPTIVGLLADDELGAQRERFEVPLPQTYYDAFEAIEHDPNHELVAAELDETIIASLHLMFLPHLSYQGGMIAKVASVRVAREYRGRGIGTEMMRWTLERARQRGCHMMQLTSDLSRKDAHRFYEKLGFERSNVGMKIIL